MGRALVIIDGAASRAKAAKWVALAPLGTRVEFKRSKRTTPQNDRMWAMLTIISGAVQWHGMTLPPEDWKLIFMASLRKEMRIVPNIEGDGFVNLGTRSSDLSKQEHSDLTMIIEAFAAARGVDLMEQTT